MGEQEPLPRLVLPKWFFFFIYVFCLLWVQAHLLWPTQRLCPACIFFLSGGEMVSFHLLLKKINKLNFTLVWFCLSLLARLLPLSLSLLAHSFSSLSSSTGDRPSSLSSLPFSSSTGNWPEIIWPVTLSLLTLFLSLSQPPAAHQLLGQTSCALPVSLFSQPLSLS